MIVYIVQKLHWEYNDDWFLLTTDDPICAYADRSIAESVVAEQEGVERACLRGANLGAHFGFFLLSAAGPDVLLQQLYAAGAPIIQSTEDTYSDSWWSGIWQGVPESKLWELCDCIHFAEVVAVEIEA